MPYRRPLLRFLLARVDERPALPASWLWIGIACFAAGLLLRVALSPLLYGNVPYITFYPALIVAGVWGGMRGGLVTLVPSALVGAYFWLPADDPVGSATVVALYLAMGALILVVTSTLLRAVGEYKAVSERARMLAQEMRHRVQNLLAVVMALSHQTARTAQSVEQYQANLGSRLLALSRAQKLIGAEQAANGPALEHLLVEVLEPFGLQRFHIGGPRLELPVSMGPNLALLFNELATNATKYGALSGEAGRVRVSWRTREGGTTLIEWREEGGPPVAAPQTEGFGSILIRAAFPPDQALVERSFDEQGVRCVVTLMPARADADGRVPPPSA
jgi:two-component sensor histidine kinase